MDISWELGAWTVVYSPKLWLGITAAVMEGFRRASWGGPEVGGVLFGRREGADLRILAFRALPFEHPNGPAFEISEENEAVVRQVLDEGVEGLEAVGWYHSKWSSFWFFPKDIELYDRFFPEPWQIALVVERVKAGPGTAGFYYRDEGGVIRSSSRVVDLWAAQEEMEAPPQPEKPEVPVEEPEKPVPIEEPEDPEEPAADPETPEDPEEELLAESSAPEPVPAPEVEKRPEPCTERADLDAFEKLVYGVQNNKGLIVVIGEAGTGKTALLARLGDFLNEQGIEFAMLMDGDLSSADFYKAIAYDLALPCAVPSKTQVLYALTDLVLKQANRGRTTVLLVDNAHKLPLEVLDEIRFLDDLQSNKRKLLNVVLCGRPELEQRLDEPELRELKQRVVVRCRVPSAAGSQ